MCHWCQSLCPIRYTFSRPIESIPQNPIKIWLIKQSYDQNFNHMRRNKSNLLIPSTWWSKFACFLWTTLTTQWVHCCSDCCRPFRSQPTVGQGAPWWAWGPMEGYRGALEEACTDWPQICSITATPCSSSEDKRTGSVEGTPPQNHHLEFHWWQQRDGTARVKEVKIGPIWEKYNSSVLF